MSERFTREQLDILEREAKRPVAGEHWITLPAADVLALVAALREAWAENALILQRLSSVYSGVLEDIEKLPPDSDFKYLYTSFLRDMQMWVRQYPSIAPDRSAASDEATGGGG